MQNCKMCGHTFSQKVRRRGRNLELQIPDIPDAWYLVVHAESWVLYRSLAVRPAGDAGKLILDGKTRPRSNTCCRGLIIVDRVDNIVFSSIWDGYWESELHARLEDVMKQGCVESGQWIDEPDRSLAKMMDDASSQGISYHIICIEPDREAQGCILMYRYTPKRPDRQPCYET